MAELENIKKAEIGLKNILKDRFEVDIDEIIRKDEQAMNKHLMGAPFRLQPRDFLYIYFDVERIFGISIPQEDVVSGGFNTFNNIVDIIQLAM